MKTSLRFVFALLIVVGLTAAALRAILLPDLFARFEPARVWYLAALGLTEPSPERRAEAVARTDRKFATHPATTLMHVLTGAGFLLLVPLQLRRRLRERKPAVHRALGRVAIVLAWASGLTGLYFGLRDPVAGPPEQVIAGAAGLVLLGATAVALYHIRAGRVAQHREWMLRAIAAAVAISTIRLVAGPLDLLLTPRNVGPFAILALSMWLGWGLTLAVAEWWIRSTRPQEHSP